MLRQKVIDHECLISVSRLMIKNTGKRVIKCSTHQRLKLYDKRLYVHKRAANLNPVSLLVCFNLQSLTSLIKIPALVDNVSNGVDWFKIRLNIDFSLIQFSYNFSGSRSVHSTNKSEN